MRCCIFKLTIQVANTKHQSSTLINLVAEILTVATQLLDG